MPLEPIVQLMAHARRHRYAVGYFESWDVASLEGVIDAAEASRAPVVVGFNGEFLAHANRQPAVRLEWYGALARAAAESARVPCAAMFNECAVDAAVQRATQAGFNVVMLADQQAPYADLVRRIAEVVSLAHPRGVAVEAELGVLPVGKEERGERGGTQPVSSSPSSLTDPEQAARFVEQTSVDLLAVSAGNVHIMLDGRCDLNLAQLAAIQEKTRVPLVLHGGSGISDRTLVEAIGLGVAKVNYGTYLKQRCTDRILHQWCPGAAAANPHEALGGGGDADLMVIVRRTVRDAVRERIEFLGCCGKA